MSSSLPSLPSVELGGLSGALESSTEGNGGNEGTFLDELFVTFVAFCRTRQPFGRARIPHRRLPWGTKGLFFSCGVRPGFIGGFDFEEPAPCFRHRHGPQRSSTGFLTGSTPLPLYFTM